ncbi:MAG: ABC transporter ATP-binding protein [Pseudomonadota bacterium]
MSLEVQSLSVTLSGRPIVREASLSVAGGECVGLVGPNGAGKTSLLRAIVGAAPKVGGAISVGGVSLVDLKPKERARRIAYLPQDHHLEWALGARDVVALGRTPYLGAFGARTAQCDSVIDASMKSVHVDALDGQPFSTLSGGEKARVLLARALAVCAPVLLADEPVAALDPYHQLQVMEILKSRAQAGDAVLVVLHDLNLAARFLDRVILMSDGRIIDDGPPHDVLTKDAMENVYKVTPLSGDADGETWLIPWRRLKSD